MSVVARAIGILVTGGGAGCMVWAARTLGARRFLGRPSARPFLVLRGPFRYVRHPFYAATICVLAGAWWLSGAAALGVALCLALPGVGGLIVVEERKLVERCGEAYQRYRTAVPALIPWRWRRP